MKRIFMASLALAVAAVLTGVISASAQTAPQAPQAQAPPRQAGPPQTMDLATAKKMVAAAEAAASAMNQHIAICVMDTDGDVVLSERMDGVNHTPVATAEGKARTALIFGLPTGQVADAIQAKKPITATLSSVPNGAGGEITLQFRGGLPVMKDGKQIGSIGVGGSASEQDEKFSQAGIDAISAK
jgi:glc operon protein GlcG